MFLYYNDILMTLKETIKSWIYEKERNPEEIAEDIEEVGAYLQKIPSELLMQYKQITGKNRIKIFSKKRIDDSKMRNLSELIVHIWEDNTLNLEVFDRGEHKGWSHGSVSVWDRDLRKGSTDRLLSAKNWREYVSKYKKDIFKLEKKLQDKIRNYKIINPVKNAIKDAFTFKKSKKNTPETA